MDAHPRESVLINQLTTKIKQSKQKTRITQKRTFKINNPTNTHQMLILVVVVVCGHGVSPA